jgi:hypothetical protein
MRNNSVPKEAIDHKKITAEDLRDSEDKMTMGNLF